TEVLLCEHVHADPELAGYVQQACQRRRRALFLVGADDGLFQSQFLSKLLLRETLLAAQKFQVFVNHGLSVEVLMCWGVDVGHGLHLVENLKGTPIIQRHPEPYLYTYIPLYLYTYIPLYLYTFIPSF